LIPSGGAVLHLNAIEDVLSAHGADRVATEERFQHVELARLLAKAAYGFLIGELGRARVKGSYLLPIIFGDVSAAGLYIGSSDKVLNFKPSDPAFKFTSYRFPLDRGGHEIAVAIIRLLPHLATGPAYVVVCDLNEVNSA
jgi:hypothetical protein